MDQRDFLDLQCGGGHLVAQAQADWASVAETEGETEREAETETETETETEGEAEAAVPIRVASMFPVVGLSVPLAALALQQPVHLLRRMGC